MLTALLLSLRETIEAVLIIGLVLSTLRATQRREHERFVWFGSITGVVLSIVIALVLNRMGAELEGAAEELFEGLTMLLAASVLTWMIFWMQKQSRQKRHHLADGVRKAGLQGRGFPLFSLAFLAVFR
ncbi:MAG: iron transporter, partial [Anaerolineales bacterium]